MQGAFVTSAVIAGIAFQSRLRRWILARQYPSGQYLFATCATNNGGSDELPKWRAEEPIAWRNMVAEEVAFALSDVAKKRCLTGEEVRGQAVSLRRSTASRTSGREDPRGSPKGSLQNDLSVARWRWKCSVFVGVTRGAAEAVGDQ